MADESTGVPGGGPTGPPSFPGNAPPPPVPPPMPPPAPPSYPGGPSAPSGGYPPPSGGQYGAAPAYGYGNGQAQGPPYAGWGARLGGWLIDAVIIAVVQAIVSALFRKSNALTLHFTDTMNNGTVRHGRVDFLAIIVVTIVALAYNTILVGGARGQTVGMMAVGIRAVRDGTYDGAVGYGKAAARWLLQIVFWIVVVIPWILDMLWPLWDGKNQTLHDKAVGTVVLRVRATG
jgi:uncharacterized RDD family membrane protein YckC